MKTRIARGLTAVPSMGGVGRFLARVSLSDEGLVVYIRFTTKFFFKLQVKMKMLKSTTFHHNHVPVPYISSSLINF